MELLLVDLPLRFNFVAPLNLAILKSIANEIGIESKCIDFSIQYNKEYEKIFVSYLDENIKKSNAFGEVSFILSKIPEKNLLDKLSIEIADKINEYEPKVVGITTRADNVYLAISIARYLKSKVILGGPGVFFSYNYLKKYDEIDHIFVGEAELTFRKYIKKIIEGREIPKVIIPNKQFDLRNSPIPDYDDFELENYFYIGIETQRGCINSCRYCSSRFYPFPYFKLKPIETFEKEIRGLLKYGNRFFLCDNIPNPTKKRIIELCKVLSKYDVKFQCELVPDIDEEVAFWLKKAGIIKVALGVESLSDSCIRLMGRRYLWKSILKSLRALKKYNIPVHCMFIFGFPNESLSSTILTIIRLIKYADLFGTIAPGSYRLTYNSYVHKHPEEFGIKILEEGEREAILNCLPYEQPLKDKLRNKIRKFLVYLIRNYFDVMGKVEYWSKVGYWRDLRGEDRI